MILELTYIITPEEFEVYFRLLWLFVVIMFFLIALICYLYLTIRRAQEREAQSFTFSRLMIAGQEAERQRISCELHDTVLPEIGQESVRERIREICTELMPPDFSRLSLKDSLASLCSGFSKRTGIECLPAMEEDLDFRGIRVENQLHLYRMVQEAFTNIEKHAHASRVVLVARGQKLSSGAPGGGAPGSALICVSDDGVGLPPPGEGRIGAGLGMRSMRWRAACLGAQLDFISENGNGLMVRIEVPLSPPDRSTRI
jgi:two-component system NarL family sensor kinase